MQLPGPVRAVIGLAALAADEAKRLPDRAIELPMLAVSSALQASLRAQQRYARLAARGDDVLNHRPAGDDPPPWATFDDPAPVDEVPVDELRGVSEDTSTGAEPPRKTPAQHPPAQHPPVKRSPAKAGAAAKAGSTAKKPAKKVSAAQQTPGKTQQTPGKTRQTPGKTINAPRHTSPSRFDTIRDE